MFVLAAAAYVFYARRLPEDAPLARMYRTEATLRLLVRAVDGYRAAHGAWPPAGPEGLERAVAHLSRNVNYLPEGVPRDAWDRAYVYVPADEYDGPDSLALRGPDGAWHAPGACQIYSRGADGDAGIGNPAAQRDNIVSWDPDRSWRPHYRTLNRRYRKENP